MLSRPLSLVAVVGIAVAAASPGAVANTVTPVAKYQSFIQLVGDYDGPRHERGYRRGWDSDGPGWGRDWRGGWRGGRCRFVRHECADRFGWRTWRFDRCLDNRGC